MTNYSFEPPAKKAMDEAELSELISGMSADESGIEKAMKILQEQETLRLADQQNLEAWRQAMIDDGSFEALTAVEKITGEVLIEPDPEPQSEARVQPETGIQPETGGIHPDETIEEDSVASSDEDATSEEEPTATVEVIDESISVIEGDGTFEIDYQSVTVSTEIRKVASADFLQEALVSAARAKPKKIRQVLSSKFVLGLSLAAGIFALLVIGQVAVLPSNPWASVGTLLGALAGFGIYVGQGFQKESFRSSVAHRFGALGIYWQALLLASASLVLVAVSNLARDNRLFTDLAVSPAKIVDYRVDEVALVVVAAILFAALMAWQPMLRFGLTRLFAIIGLTSVGLVVSGVEFSEATFGDFDAFAFSAGAVLALFATAGLGVVLQPNFASSHERPTWAVGEFNTRHRRVASLHGFLFVLLPAVLAFVVGISDINMGNISEYAQFGLLTAYGLALMVLLIGVLDHSNVYFKLVAFAILSAGLVLGEYLTDDWVEGLTIIGVLLLAALAGAGFVIRFFVRNMQYPWLVFAGTLLGGATGWLIENPFGLLDLGFTDYSELQGHGFGLIAAIFVSAVISLGTIGRAKTYENS